MCYNGKCLNCIPVENGYLVYGILQFLHAISCFFILLQFLRLLLNAEFEGKAVTPQVVITCIIFFVGFIFSVLLCFGICKRLPEVVKAYFIFGVMVLVLMILFTIGEIAPLVELEIMGYIVVTVVVVFGIHILILWMVFATYMKLYSEAAHKNHVKA